MLFVYFDVSIVVSLGFQLINFLKFNILIPRRNFKAAYNNIIVYGSRTHVFPKE